jgi:hypothetical protein
MLLAGRWRITSVNMKVCTSQFFNLSWYAGVFADDDGHRFTLTPQRMRMIVEAFKDALELGLEKDGQIVVRSHTLHLVHRA